VECKRWVHHDLPFIKEGVKVAAMRVIPMVTAFRCGPLPFGERKKPGPKDDKPKSAMALKEKRKNFVEVRFC
jgi:hypothetical protein